jgi:uncharacterized membrane protein
LWWGGFWWFGPLLNVVSEMIADHVPPALGPAFAAWKAAYALCVAASALGFARIAHRFDWAAGRWLSATCWAVLVLASIRVLDPLYNTSNMPYAVHWMAWAGVLAASEYLLSFWAAREWRITRIMLETLHGLRLGGPWLAIWPAGAILVSRWLADTPDQQALMASAGWGISAAWSNYLPTWAMILVLTWLMRRTRQEKWPATPLSDWYRAILIPCGVAFLVLLVIAWNFTQDGTMAPLPYLPLLNPLDLTTGFVVLAGIGASRLLAVAGDGNVRRMNTIRVAAAGASYLWFNLMLLRSAAHYLGIAYAFDALMASQFVQALLSLVWTCTALVLMRHAATHERRKQWSVGAALLVVVVAKLFIADLGDGGSMARVITFVGVGLLMVLIGYLAPYPKAGERQASGNELRP